MIFKNKYLKYQYKYIQLLVFQNGGKIDKVIYKKLEKLILYIKRKYGRLNFQDRELLKIVLKKKIKNKKYNYIFLNDKIQNNSNINDNIKKLALELKKYISDKNLKEVKTNNKVIFTQRSEKFGLVALFYIGLFICKISLELKISNDNILEILGIF
jgi:hypothetical protein